MADMSECEHGDYKGFCRTSVRWVVEMELLKADAAMQFITEGMCED